MVQEPWSHLFVCSVLVFKVLSTCLPLVSSSSHAIQVEKLPDITDFLTSNITSLTSFKGLSDFLNGSYPDEEVIKTVETPEMLILNETESYVFKCKVIRPIIALPVYLEIVMKGWPSPSRFFTGGKKLPEDEPDQDSNTSLSWTEEYEFEVDLDIQMYGVQCVGMDVYNNGTWRKNWRRIQFVYGVSPAVYIQPSREYGHRVFTIGERARLVCPMWFGVPRAKITWNLPSGKQQKTDEKELEIEKVSHSDGGEFTCVAENKYGNSSYTFTVRLDDPPFWERVRRRLERLWEGLKMIGFLLVFGAPIG